MILHIAVFFRTLQKEQLAGFPSVFLSWWLVLQLVLSTGLCLVDQGVSYVTEAFDSLGFQSQSAIHALFIFDLQMTVLYLLTNVT